MTNIDKMLVMKAQLADAYRVNKDYGDAVLWFNTVCQEYVQGHWSFEKVEMEFKAINPIMGGYVYGPKPLNHIYGFRNIKISY